MLIRSLSAVVLTLLRSGKTQRCGLLALLALITSPLAAAQVPSCFFPSPETIACNQSREGKLTFTDCEEGGYRFDLWKVALSAGSTASVFLEMDSFLDEPYLEMYDPAGTLRGSAESTPSNSRLAGIGGPVDFSGTWTIYASEVDNFITSADYSLSVDCLSAPPPPPPPPTTACVEDATTACLLNGRFRATVRYRNSFDDAPANTTANRVNVTGFASPSFETEFFYLLDSTNIEVIVKMMDAGGRNLAGQLVVAVLTGTATPLRVEVMITDTLTGAQRSYVSPFGSQRGVTEFDAFNK
jgi:hypothetical protein